MSPRFGGYEELKAKERQGSRNDLNIPKNSSECREGKNIS